MNKILCISLLILFSCNKTKTKSNREYIKVEHLKKTKTDSTFINQEKLIHLINKNLANKVEVYSFLDSLTNQNKVNVLETFDYSYDSEDNIKIYKSSSSNKEYKLKIIEKKSSTNTLFYDGNTIIDFSKYRVLTVNNSKYKSEDFGFNYYNILDNLRLLEIAKKQFLYADISFRCNGMGCGCKLNFIYDINTKKAFFIDNIRFPYSGFISDFNNDNIVDLLVVGRNKYDQLKGLPIYENSYQVTWLEYDGNDFKVKKNKDNHNISYEIISYGIVPNASGTDFSLIKNE